MCMKLPIALSLSYRSHCPMICTFIPVQSWTRREFQRHPNFNLTFWSDSKIWIRLHRSNDLDSLLFIPYNSDQRVWACSPGRGRGTACISFGNLGNRNKKWIFENFSKKNLNISWCRARRADHDARVKSVPWWPLGVKKCPQRDGKTHFLARGWKAHIVP